jgi:hypothetical protein
MTVPLGLPAVAWIAMTVLLSGHSKSFKNIRIAAK